MENLRPYFVMYVLSQMIIKGSYILNSGFPLDLLRCESLLGLDPATCSRVLNKNYTLLVSMAPLTNEIRPISSCTPQVKKNTVGGKKYLVV